MRVLYARAGIPYSPFTGKPIESQTVTQIVDKIKTLPKKSTIYLYAPIVRGRKGEYKKEILGYKKRGFRKIKIDEILYDIEKVPELNKKVKHDISILVDRIVLNSSLGNRLAEGIETSINLAGGLLFVEYEDETLPKKFRKLEKIIKKFKKAKIRTSLFINPSPNDIRLAKKLNADCIEIHTGKLANLVKSKKNYSSELNRIKKSSILASSLNIEVHAGHGLDYKTTKMLIKIIDIEEYNIGHFIIGESIFYGLSKVIKNFKKIIKK